MIGAKVKELRKAKGLYQRQLAVTLDTDSASNSKVDGASLLMQKFLKETKQFLK